MDVFKCHTRLEYLVLTNAVFHLLHLQVHSSNMQLRSDIFFQIIFSNLSGPLLHGETRFILSRREVQRWQPVRFQHVIGNDRKIEDKKSFI